MQCVPSNRRKRREISRTCDLWPLRQRYSIHKVSCHLSLPPISHILTKPSFFTSSFNEVNPEHKSIYSAWETPDPVFWTRQGYIVVRADERGLGQSPGILDTMSRGTSECFFDVVEWAAVQPWSSGKVGLLGISYYAGETSLPHSLEIMC